MVSPYARAASDERRLLLSLMSSVMLLTAAIRKKMPASAFAGPGTSFPINDANHARLAISGATRSMHAGNISAEEAASIKAKARQKLQALALRSG